MMTTAKMNLTLEQMSDFVYKHFHMSLDDYNENQVYTNHFIEVNILIFIFYYYLRQDATLGLI